MKSLYKTLKQKDVLKPPEKSPEKFPNKESDDSSFNSNDTEIKDQEDVMDIIKKMKNEEKIKLRNLQLLIDEEAVRVNERINDITKDNLEMIEKLQRSDFDTNLHKVTDLFEQIVETAYLSDGTKLSFKMNKLFATRKYNVGNIIGRGNDGSVSILDEATLIKQTTDYEIKIVEELLSKVDNWDYLTHILEIKSLSLVMKNEGWALLDFMNSVTITMNTNSIILVAEIIKQICCGVNKLHILGFQHRDIAPRNIFIKLIPLTVKVGDYGSMINKSWSNKVITPETNPDNILTMDSDVYQIGLILNKFLSLMLNPLSNNDPDNKDFLSLRCLSRRMLNERPIERPSCAQVAMRLHRFITSMSHHKLNVNNINELPSPSYSNDSRDGYCSGKD